METYHHKKMTTEQVSEVLNGIGFKTKPMHHQGVSLIWAMESDGRVAFWHGVGTGKSLTALYTHHLWGFERLLVVAPNSVLESWKEQIELHTDYPCIILQGSAADRKEKLKSDAKIFIVNYEGLRVLFGDRRKRWTMKIKSIQDASFDALLIDECHKTKNPKAIQTRVVKKLSESARRVIMMTGTPVSTGEEDLWSQYDCLDGGGTLGASRWNFLKQYFTQDFFGQWTIKHGSMKDILDRVASVTLRYSRDECFDLPDRVYQERRCDLSTEQCELTDDIIHGRPIKHGEHELIVDEPMLVANKLAQVAGGFLTIAPGVVMRLKRRNPKLVELVEAVNETKGKVIVFHAYVEEGRIIEEKLRNTMTCGIVSLRGETPDKAKVVKRFTTDDDCKVLVAHPESGGVGLNFQCAAHMIFYSNGCCGATVREQAEGRIWRLGQEQKCLYIDLLLRDSIDEARLEKTRNRAAMSEKILDYIKNWGA